MSPKRKGSQKRASASKQQGDGSVPSLAGGSRVSVSSVQISSGNEARIKDLLQALQPQMGSALDSDLGENTKPASVQQLSVVYDELLHHGFTEEQAQNALRSIPKASIQLEAALEWLLLNIPPEQLPARFTGAQRLRAPAAGGIRKVVEAASSSPAAGREADGAAAAQEDAAARDAAAEAVAQLRPAAELRQLQQQQEAAQQQQAAEDKAALKSYIMAQHNRDSGSQAGSEASSDDLADYDPWATPEEKQRRRQERAKAKIPPEVRRAQIAVEWADAKDAAAAAKAARNKAKQQECGKRIRDLKQEMEALGLSEAMLQELLSPLAQQRPQPGADAEVPAAPSVGPGEASTPETQPLPAEHDEPSSAAVLGPTSAWEWSTGAPPAGAVREDAPGGSSTIQEPGAGPGGEEGSCASGHGGAGGQEAAPVTEVEAAAEGKLGEAAVDLQQQQRQHEEEEEEEGFEVPSLFDEDQSSDLTADAGQSRARREADLDLLTPWGYNAPRPNRSGRKPAAPAPPEQLPKALLQQYCQRMSLPGPRYSRVSKPGEPAVRYSVTVTFPPAKGRHRFARHSGPRTFGLLESEDGWQSIQDAQNAAATRALFEVADNAPLYLMLSQPFRDLWIRWEDSLDGDRQEAAEQRRASKQQFLDSLMQEAQPARTAPEKCADRLASSSAANDTSARPLHASPTLLQQDDNRDDIPRPRVVLNAEPARTREGSSLQMKEALMAWRSSDTGQSWMEKRNALPVAAITDQLAAALQRCDAVLVSGDTGCGKTTQIPQFILDDAVLQGHGSACHVICTQPRRIAAVSVARRVAEERGEGRPGGPGCVTGYHVRMDAAVSAATRLLFCTTGILLRRMASDPQLDEVSHVVVDEVHERSVQSDFLLALLRDLLPLRRAQGRPLKVVMMSATVDPVLYTSYFNQFQVEALHTQGRTFPVEQHFLEDVYEMVEYTLGPDASMRSGRGPSTTRKAVLGQAGAKARALLQAGWGNEEADAEPLNPHYDPELYPPERYCARTRSNLARLDERATDLDLVEELVAHIDKHHDPGAVLVFLPGMAEISAMVDRLDSHPQFGRAQPPSHVIVALHSTVSTASQLAAFRKPPQGVRKIVLATNIAETSLTIDDVVYVVDAGKVKERWHNHARGMSLLVESLVSQAAAKQRRGRAGRSRPGVAYALFTRDCFVRRMAVRPVPEILRVPLEETVLTVHLLGLAPAGPMLSRMLQPPPDKAAAAAVARLQEVGALSTQEALTPLGRHLALLPVDVHIGKMLVLSACLGCLSPALSIAACLSHKPPFLSSLDDNDRSDRARRALAAPLAGGDAAAAQLSARMLAAGQQSDHLLMAAALQLWLSSGSRSAARRVAQQHCLAEPAIKMLADLRLQLGGMLADAGLVRREDARREGEGWEGGAWVDAPWLPANRHSDKPAVVKAALTAALYPKVAVMQAGVAATRRPEWHDSSGTVHVHPTAVVHPLTAAQFRARFLVFQEKMKTSKVFVKDCTVVSPLALLLLGGRELDIHHEAGYIEMDGWIRISADAATAVLVKKLRASLEQVLEKAVRSRGGQGRERTVEQQQLMDTLVGMLVEDDAKSEAA